MSVCVSVVRECVIGRERERECVCVCVCSLRYPACNAHAPYCHAVACPAIQYFSTLSHKWQDFRKKKVTEHKMCVLIFLELLSGTIFHSKKN